MPQLNVQVNLMPKSVSETIIVKLNELRDLILPYAKNLTGEERQQYGSIDERNKLMVEKVNDFHVRMPDLNSEDVDWKMYTERLRVRTAGEEIVMLCESIIEGITDTGKVIDYALMEDARVDYDWTRYKAKRTGAGGGYTKKYEELKQLMPNPTGTNGKEEENDDEDGAAPANPVK